MENNITDALIMAGSVLIFVMGLSISMLAFSQARESIDILLSYSDRESLTIEDDPQFYYKASEQDTERYVGKETIIPAIYRAYKENYKIIFQFPDDYYLFKRRMTNRQESINRIDLGEQHNNSTGSSESLISIGSDLDSRYFVEGILYQKFNLLGVSKNKQDYERKFQITLNNKSLSLYLDEKQQTFKIKETSGIYYIEDLLGASSAEKEDVDKTPKRVITYSFEGI